MVFARSHDTTKIQKNSGKSEQMVANKMMIIPKKTCTEPFEYHWEWPLKKKTRYIIYIYTCTHNSCVFLMCHLECYPLGCAHSNSGGPWGVHILTQGAFCSIQKSSLVISKYIKIISLIVYHHHSKCMFSSRISVKYIKIAIFVLRANLFYPSHHT